MSRLRLRSFVALGALAGAAIAARADDRPPPVTRPGEADAARAARKAAALAANEEGVKLAEKGELEAALGKFAEALAHDPEDATIRSNAGKVHAAVGKRRFDARKFEEAAKEFRRAADLCPDELDYLHDEGVSLVQAGADREAVPVLERVLAKKEDRPATLVVLGQALYRLGRNKDAIARWERALALSPDDKALAEALAKAKKEESIEGELVEDLGAPHFTIKFDGRSDPRIGRIVGQALEDAYRDVGYDLNRFPRGEVAVVVYPKQAFRAVTGSHGWVAALYDGKIRVPAEGIDAAQPSEIKRVLVHEYTHALVRSIAGSGVPAWLHEGIAQLEEGRTSADARATLRGKELPTLDDLAGTFLSDPDADRVRVRYAAAFDFVGTLAQRRGKAALAELLDRMGKGEKLDDASTAVFGAGTRALFDEWRGAVAR